MRLTIERGALLRTLSHVHSVVERRNTIPILSNVLIEASAGKLSLTATDLDLSIVEDVGAEVRTPGATTAPAHTLFDIVRKLPDGAEVELTYKADEGGGRLVLSAGRSRFALTCLPREDFPVMTDGALPHRFAIAAGSLRDLIDKTRFAISTEETRYYLNGIYLHAMEVDGMQVLRGVATDGHRLARIQLPLPEGASGIPGVIVPRKAVQEVRKLLDECQGDVVVTLSETKIRFTLDGVTLTSKLIDGTFPEYSRVIPTANDKVLEVDAKAFAQAVDRVSSITSEKTRAVKLALDTDRVLLTVTSPDQGSASEELAATYRADPLEIGFNARYLLDITAQIDSETARFVLADPVAPTLVRDSEDETALYVLMPMRV
ncbi:DNA polymerase III subunit beta [Zavarzinia sp. CC-PAN008]|uniref:DNA polymerase III subunit beta n=1 Tax=Zavarzinia sp. CC-PAN008 TaxID=3243332 RepID=UPI003F7427E4